MEKQEVESSVIHAVGHTRVLEIEFESGRVYQYFDVPQDIYDNMLQSDSKGRYFNQHIRGKFPYQEIQLIKRK
ncbi:MAG TPA: KTSC domain-containing protein [Oceanobacillus sp.]|nr:KTSC domain-containing protein [Oceanobacillus sp.]